MERSGDEEERLQDEKAGDPPSRSAQALARTRAALDARRERDAIRLRHPAFRNDDVRTLIREASEIAIAAGLAMESVAREPPPARPGAADRPRPPPSFSPPPALPLRPPEPVAPPVFPAEAPPVVKDEPAETAPPSRWDEGAPPGLRRHRGGRFVAAMARLDPLRVILAAILVALAGGGVYAGLRPVQPEEALPAVAESAPPVLELRPIRVRTIRIPVPPAPQTVSADAASVDLSLRGAIPGFAQVVPGAPSEACATLIAAGWSTQGWGDSPVGARGECLAERRYGVDGDTNSFAVLRGGHTLAELRIKLNLGDVAWRAEAGRDAGHLVATLFESWRWEGGAALEDRIAALQPFEDAVNGTVVRLTREHGDVERLNLLMRFPQPLQTPGAGAAEAQAAALATLSAIVAAHVGGTELLAEPPAPEPQSR